MCRSVDHLIKDCNFHAKPRTPPTPKNYAHRGYNKQHASFTKNHPKKHIVLAAVLTKSKPVYVTATRPVSAAVPKIMITRPKHARSLNTKSNSTIRRHKTRNQSSKPSNSSPKVTAAKAQVVYKNKRDERGIVVRNKARLVTQGHTQEEGIDYKKVFDPVARIEAIRLFLAYASFMGFMVYQMDVKSTFLYGTIEEEVYVCQPLGFEYPAHPDKVYKVVKALYGLHQAPRAWYETLANYLLKMIYVDDIIFRATNKDLCKSFEKLVKDKFQMSSIGELTFFLGLQVKQKEDGIFISQDKYVAEILKKIGLTEGKLASTPIDTEKPLLKDPNGEDVIIHIYRSMIGSLMYLTSSRPDIMFAVCACARFQVTPKVLHLHAVKRIFRYLKGKPHLGLWYPKDSPLDLVAYSDSDYTGASLERKSTTRGCQFLGCRLISWQCKKQTVVTTSSTEAKYVASASYYAQVLWIQNQLLDYEFICQSFQFCWSQTSHTKSSDEILKPFHRKGFSEESWLVQKQTALGKDKSNPLMADNLPKIVWYSTQHVTLNKELASPKANGSWANDNWLQALVDKKKVVVTKAAIKDALHLDDAKGVDCLPIEEIFTALARMGYEKPSTKLTFYKAFFSSQ
nr:putative ribonuclease H-like domain-containing protein [Tanacetum cinerariifolium]